MKVFRRCAVVAAGIGALMVTSLPVAGPAAAKEGFPVTLVCDNGQIYDVVVVPGNGEFTPAKDQDSRLVLIPVAFGPFTGTVRDPDGNVVETFTEPGSVKGSGKQKSDATCTFEFSGVSDGSDPDFFPEGFSFEGSGSVDVKFSGRR